MKKIVLAYSGGLDTSIILRWLQENYNAEVIAYTSDIGQEINRKKIITNAKRLGVKNIIIEDLKNVFVKDYVFPMIRAHAVYEGVYLLGTSIARPLIAKRQIAIAKKFKAYAVSHGATGKGNDQVRFELGYAFFGGKKIKTIAPWREWKLQSRADLIKYAKKNNIPIPKDKKGAPPFSVDDNIFHTSTEGKVLENPKNSAPELIFQRTISPEKAPNKKTKVKITFKNSDPIAVNGKKLRPDKLLDKLNILAGKNGIGRVDLVENRFIGIKSRGVYETPGGTLLYAAHRAIESVTLDKKTAVFLSKVTDSIALCAAYNKVPPGVSYTPLDLIPINLFSTRSTLPMPFFPARIFNLSKSLSGLNFFPFTAIGSLFLKVIFTFVFLFGAFSGEMVL